MTLAEIAARGTHPAFKPFETYEARRAELPSNHLVCADGTKLSVIAGVGCYSTPRPDWFNGVPEDYSGPYTAVEVMVGIDPPAEWEEYEAGGVYGQVPIALVQALIDEHGGEAQVQQNSQETK